MVNGSGDLGCSSQGAVLPEPLFWLGRQGGLAQEVADLRRVVRAILDQPGPTSLAFILGAFCPNPPLGKPLWGELSGCYCGRRGADRVGGALDDGAPSDGIIRVGPRAAADRARA